MFQTVWRDSPSVPLLQWLARGSLKQNLPQAVRLWVWLHLLYGEKEVRLNLPDPFTYPNWRDAFFSASHPKGDEKPSLHDPYCFCTKVTAAWLFGNDLRLRQSQWEKLLSQPGQRQQIQQQERQFKQALQQHDATPQELQQFLYETRLFGMTRRTLYEDLQILVDIHWLKRVGQQYYRVNQFPPRPVALTSHEVESRLVAWDLEFLTQPDLAAIADNLSQSLNGQRRFFVHVEYVVAQEQLDQVDELQAQLRQIWQQTPVVPVLLRYCRAGAKVADSVVIYPVCIYYYQRGPYLCGFGQVPQGEPGILDWRNYRLDRIQSLTRLSWDDSRVPLALLQQHQEGTLPTSEELRLRMTDAWGFDYYQPAQLLLLRFDREWNDRYIQNTLRHATFESVKYKQVETFIRNNLTGEQREIMLNLWRSRSPKDAYYQAQYRQDDPNVRQRLRAWRPRAEVLLPWDLRQRMALEVEQEWQLYHGG